MRLHVNIAQHIFSVLLLILSSKIVKKMEIDVIVQPNARKFLLSQKNGKVRISVRAKPDRGRANAELVLELSQRLGCEVEIVRGQKTPKKKLRVSCENEEFEKLIQR